MQQESVQILPKNMFYTYETEKGNKKHKNQPNLTMNFLSELTRYLCYQQDLPSNFWESLCIFEKIACMEGLRSSVLLCN